MTFKKLFLADWPLLILIALSLAADAYFYPHLPAHVPIHWGLLGQPRSGPPWMGAFLPGLVALGLYLLFSILPLVDPWKRNYPAFFPFYRFLRWFIWCAVKPRRSGRGYKAPPMFWPKILENLVESG